MSALVSPSLKIPYLFPQRVPFKMTWLVHYCCHLAVIVYSAHQKINSENETVNAQDVYVLTYWSVSFSPVGCTCTRHARCTFSPVFCVQNCVYTTGVGNGGSATLLPFSNFLKSVNWWVSFGIFYTYISCRAVNLVRGAAFLPWKLTLIKKYLTLNHSFFEKRVGLPCLSHFKSMNQRIFLT